MRKKLYAIYSKLDKDSVVISAKDEEECIDATLNYILDSEEFDDFFDLDGKIRLNNKNRDLFYDVMSEYQIYFIGFYDSETMRIEPVNASSIDIKSMLQALSKAIVI